LGVTLLPWPSFDESLVREYLSTAYLLVQATSAGMKGKAGGKELTELLPWSSFRQGVAYDLVYTPPRTEFLEKAQSEGHFSQGGLGMLVGQAAHALNIWFAQTPAQSDLMAVAQKALGL